MPIQTGTRLGPYEITGPLGAGGMGEVYRARDSRIDRDVAIKILPADCAASPERLSRFALEAKTTGSLNHPNLLVIFAGHVPDPRCEQCACTGCPARGVADLLE